MVMSRDVRNRLEKEIKADTDVYVNPRFVSKFNGNRKCNIEYFEKKGIKLNIIPDESVEEFEIRRA